ncbi:alpha/beta fold hydrolase [Sphingobacterium corticibacter]|uniref:Alpha/beta hydrolase n=1 Tax=Sphingobacterium corticibacter TaxID=2171749 RepID=A0A2T8HI41_9SPHI|nr:alpha/beta hydrolase [Sphingobacterium corticibacter]PVH25116.1 alpha/beta hydrolase [Sphingobacterium corticibacter]
MAKITNKSNGQLVDIHYQDQGSGKPVVLIHGWPLSHTSWNNQTTALVDAGYRVIAYDRRGFGDSTTGSAYDYDSLTSDLHALLEELDLKEVTLVGFSMGGGEVIRYVTNYGTDRIAKLALVASIIPLVKQKDDNPDGVPQEDLDDILANLKEDRIAFLKEFHQQFYNVDKKPDAVPESQLDADLVVSSAANVEATIEAAKAWMDTDFRPETAKISLPTLIIHGKADSTVPIATSAEQAAELISGSEFKVYEDAPHGLNVTHTEELNKDLIEFLGS